MSNDSRTRSGSRFTVPTINTPLQLFTSEVSLPITPNRVSSSSTELNMGLKSSKPPKEVGGSLIVLQKSSRQIIFEEPHISGPRF